MVATSAPDCATKATLPLRGLASANEALTPAGVEMMPMQFEPATWRAYGLGGNVQEAHDAILGAANYLHANGAEHDERAALLHYNRSTLYADAVLHYAHRIAHDTTAFPEYYAWQVYVRTPSGYRRVTGPR